MRATNTGVSAVIAPTGALLGTLGVDQRGTLVGAVTPMRDAPTVVVRWGDWFGPTALAGALGLLAVAFRPRAERRLDA